MHQYFQFRAGWRSVFFLLMVVSEILIAPSLALATDWYVDGRGGSRANPGTAAAPFVDGWQASKVARPGDTINVLPSTAYPRLAILASGTAEKPITVTGTGIGANRTRITGVGTDSALWINADYVVVSNFDVSAPGQFPGISLAPGRHHITIQRNVVHDSGGSGINTFGNDYVRILHNTVYGNAKITKDGRQGSGISLLGHIDVDDYTGLKNVVDGNLVYANTNELYCFDDYCWANRLTSDGNGIIIDDFRRKRFDGAGYRGQTLVSNNVVFGNGGRGIYMYRSDHAVIVGNTCFFNNQDPYSGAWHPGEIGLAAVGDVEVHNNILYSDAGNGPNRTGTAPNYRVSFSAQYIYETDQPVHIGRNLMFNPKTDRTKMTFSREAPNLQILDNNMFYGPRLKLPSLDPEVADFRPIKGSIALNNGDPAHRLMYDILWARRGGNTSIGAYEYAAP